jgi:UDP-glucose 4-epimerase
LRALVTGGAGFIGSHLVDALLGRGCEVVVMDDLSTGQLSNLQHLHDDANLQFVEGTVLSSEAVARAMHSCDIVYHLAAVVGVTRVVSDPLRCLLVNARGTEIVVETAASLGCKVVVASSSEVYGKSVALPLAEDGDVVLGPSTVARWSYAVAKGLGEHLALAYAAKGLCAVVVRYFNAYGPRLTLKGYANVIGRFLTQARRGEPLTVYGDGSQTRSFTYVADTVRATVLAAERPEAEGEIINIGNAEEVSVLDLAELVRQAIRSASRIVFVPMAEVYGPNFEEPLRRLPDTAKAERILGFRASVPLADGLRRTATWLASS